ncbi:MAG TPA: DUF3426 domain-containing protein [Gammaproteobacteria bacterium]|nr:DUF3426 domain-containing protein [Gammaproteobacteria bacterium]
MFTCCPECKTCFRITDEQLAIAKGLVRCGHCHQVFNGGESLTETLPDEKPTTQVSDSRHEADEHDSSIFAAEFSVSENSRPENAQIENENDEPCSSEDHSDLPSFSAQDNFTETFGQDEVAVFTPPSDLTDSQDSATTNAPSDDPFDDLFNALSDDGFRQDKSPNHEQTRPSEPDQVQTEDSYGYSDIADALKEEQNIDDIFSDMHQQLELGMAELEKKELESKTHDAPNHNNTRDTKKEKDAFNDELEINQAIDNIFADSKLPLYGEKQEDPEYRVEKEMLAAFGENAHIETSHDKIKFDDEAISIADIPHHTQDNQADLSGGKPPEHDIPRRLRDSLAIPEPQKTSPWKIIAGLLLILLLSLTLLIQLALFRSIEILHYLPQARPWLEQFCQYAPCRIHARQDVDKIRILERDIRANPQNKKALLITATIVNQAGFSQAYPDIRVSLSDLTGTVVAQRRFSPADYLGSLNSPFLLMKPGVPVHIRIDILDPGRDAVNFEFQFL